MAFKRQNMMPIGVGKNGKIPSLFIYWNEDGDTTALTAAGYIPVGNGVGDGDQLEIVAKDKKSRAQYYAALNNDGLLVLTACATAPAQGGR